MGGVVSRGNGRRWRIWYIDRHGKRRHAATWDEAVAVFDDAVRRECERKGGQS